jgi:hypothetical protein
MSSFYKVDIIYKNLKKKIKMDFIYSENLMIKHITFLSLYIKYILF